MVDVTNKPTISSGKSTGFHSDTRPIRNTANVSTRLANWILTSEPSSVGLPDRNAKDGGKFAPSLVALGAGIGAVPSSPNSGAYEFPTPNEQQQSNNRIRGGGPSRSKSSQRNRTTIS